MKFLTLGGHHFLWKRGDHEFPKVPRQYFVPPPPFDDHKFFMTLPPLRNYNVEETCNPNARSAENMHFGTISLALNKIVIKICSHPIISWFFVTPLFLMKKFCDPNWSNFWIWPLYKLSCDHQASCTGCDPAVIWNSDPWTPTNIMKLSNLLFLFSWVNFPSIRPDILFSKESGYLMLLSG